MFYPSTVFVQDRPQEMTEYAMSKAAGEILCADIARYLWASTRTDGAASASFDRSNDVTDSS